MSKIIALVAFLCVEYPGGCLDSVSPPGLPGRRSHGGGAAVLLC